jgi:hypothetical protein
LIKILKSKALKLIPAEPQISEDKQNAVCNLILKELSSFPFQAGSIPDISQKLIVCLWRKICTAISESILLFLVVIYT